MAKTKVCVIFGGMSNEHEVSLMSTKSVIDNIPADKYDVVKVGITKKGRWLFFPGSTDEIITDCWHEHPDNVPCMISPDRTTKGLIKMDGSDITIEKIDVVLPVLHGKNGEDGTLQGLLEMSGIPYCGCGVLSSALCMDKVHANMAFDRRGIPRCKWDYMMDWQMPEFDAVAERVEKELGYPIFVKPANSGSSVGVSRAESREELKNAVHAALAHDNKVIFEEFVAGQEVECAVYGNTPNLIASEVGEIGASATFYDYDDKYKNGTSKTYIPANLPAETRQTIQQLAKKAFTVMDCKGLSRVDFFVKADGTILLNEINTLPGFTHISMYPQLMQYTGMSYAELVDGIIRLGLEGAEDER
ncbi:MAG: D-alanine--D-alanine ligase [Oscillospiraceae bacterium]|nr:D-alanine--D-alanine ligase [Oscillospiraceae bacterium]